MPYVFMPCFHKFGPRGLVDIIFGKHVVDSQQDSDNSICTTGNEKQYSKYGNIASKFEAVQNPNPLIGVTLHFAYIIKVIITCKYNSILLSIIVEMFCIPRTIKQNGRYQDDSVLNGGSILIFNSERNHPAPVVIFPKHFTIHLNGM